GMYPSIAATGNKSTDQNNQAVQQAALKSQGQQGNYAVAHPFQTAGSVAGPALVTAGVAKGLKIGLPALGEAMQDAGTGTMNRTVGSLKSDFKRGANPGE